MDYVMDTIAGLDLEELIVITGHLKDVVERYVVEHYHVKARFVEQKTLDGTAGEDKLTRADEKGAGAGILLGAPFGPDHPRLKTAHARGIRWAEEVEDYPRRGGIGTG